MFKVVSIFVGTTLMFYSCDRATTQSTVDEDTLMTQKTVDMLLISSENGKVNYRFEAPLMERYELAEKPYTEYRKGLHITTYNDSSQVESDLRGDYAIFLEKEKLWEVRGNVVARNAKGEVLETEQLFWDQKTKKIYSNVESKVTQQQDVMVGEGFESDERMENFLFRKPKGRIAVNAVAQQDSTQRDSTVHHSDSLMVAQDSVKVSE
jgi:LPS export ABC transporter protein LptC